MVHFRHYKIDTINFRYFHQSLRNLHIRIIMFQTMAEYPNCHLETAIFHHQMTSKMVQVLIYLLKILHYGKEMGTDRVIIWGYLLQMAWSHLRHTSRNRLTIFLRGYIQSFLPRKALFPQTTVLPMKHPFRRLILTLFRRRASYKTINMELYMTRWKERVWRREVKSAMIVMIKNFHSWRESVMVLFSALKHSSTSKSFLTLKAPITTAADDKFCDIFSPRADDSHEITCLICCFWKKGQTLKLSSAANHRWRFMS